jgi:hypothetical protein
MTFRRSLEKKNVSLLASRIAAEVALDSLLTAAG